MKIEITNHLLLIGPPSDFCREIKARLTFPNPAFIEAEKMGRWTGNLSERLYFYHADRRGLVIPRGFMSSLRYLAGQYDTPVEIIDCRRTLPNAFFHFAGQLKPFQDEAVAAMMEADEGTLQAPTGSGKTVIAIRLIALRQQPCLVVIHTRELLHQWIDRIETFLGIPQDEIGIIGNGKKRIGDKITIGIVNSVYPIADQLKQHIGHLVIDECHRTPSRTFTEAVSAFDCRYITGLSATPYRRDGLTSLIFWYAGPLRHRINQNVLQESGDIVPAEVVLRNTGYRPSVDMATEYARGLSELTGDVARNQLIAADVAREAGNGGGVCIVLTDRREHCEALWLKIRRLGIAAELLHGQHSAKDRKEVVGRLNAGKIPVLIATGQLVGEGFDCKGLSTLFMATPLSYHGRVIQYLGRVLRPAPGKEKARVYDFIDQEGVLQAAAIKRQAIYRSNQWEVHP